MTTRAQLYKEAKMLELELGIDSKTKWPKGKMGSWSNKVKKMRKELKTRTKNYNKAI